MKKAENERTSENRMKKLNLNVQERCKNRKKPKHMYMGRGPT
jgi:hypothetical protein